MMNKQADESKEKKRSSTRKPKKIIMQDFVSGSEFSKESANDDKKTKEKVNLSKF